MRDVFTPLVFCKRERLINILAPQYFCGHLNRYLHACEDSKTEWRFPPRFDHEDVLISFESTSELVQPSFLFFKHHHSHEFYKINTWQTLALCFNRFCCKHSLGLHYLLRYHVGWCLQNLELMDLGIVVYGLLSVYSFYSMNKILSFETSKLVNITVWHCI